MKKELSPTPQTWRDFTFKQFSARPAFLTGMEMLLKWFGAFAWYYHMRKGMFTYLRSSPHHKYSYYLFKSRGVPFSSNGKLRGEFKMLKIIPSVL